jgi:hypothetical protein
MSFLQKFESMMHEFCEVVASTYHLNGNDVYKLWSNMSSQAAVAAPVLSRPVSSSSQSEKASQPDPDTEITREKIMSSNKDMLSAMCKKKGLKVTGKKEELVQRLIDSLANDAKKPPVKEPVKNSKQQQEPPVVKTIKERTVELAIRKNKFGHYEHTQTGLVFNTDKMVYGRQLDDGKVADLTVDDIESCKKYKFPYKIPENLNTSKNLDDVKIDDMDEEVLDDDDLEEEEEEAEDDDVEDEN